jgi:fungal nitric oxide reductase
MVEPFFSQDHINAMRPHIQKTVNFLLDNMLKEGGEKPFDIVDKFALPVPSYVSPSFFGQPLSLPHMLNKASLTYDKRSSMASLEFQPRTSSTSLDVTQSEVAEVRQQPKLPMPIGEFVVFLPTSFIWSSG